MNLSWQSLLTQGESYRRYGDTKERQQKWLLACLERNKKQFMDGYLIWHFLLSYSCAKCKR